MRITIAAPVLFLLSATERGGGGVASASLAPRARRTLSLKRRHRKASHASPEHDHPCAGAGVPSSPAWGRANDTMTATFSDDGELSSSSDIDDVDYLPEEFVAPFEPSETMRVARNVLVLILATVLLTGTASLSPLLSLSPAESARMRRDVVAGAAIFSLGDLLAQLLTGSRLRRLDSQRLAVSTCLGAVWSGLCVPVVYTSAEGLFPGRSPARVLAKMAVTCSVLSTAGNYATMLARRWIQELLKPEPATSTAAVVRRRSLGACVKSCNGDIGEVIMDDLKVWPLYDVACYALIPPSLRPITTAVMSSGWAMYMSVVSARTDVSPLHAPPLPSPSSSSSSSAGPMRNGTDTYAEERIRGLSRCAAA